MPPAFRTLAMIHSDLRFKGTITLFCTSEYMTTLQYNMTARPIPTRTVYPFNYDRIGVDE